MKLNDKHILLGITGSIAAYKAAILVRLLVKEGAQVKVVMTELAKEFITPLTMATLSKNPILVDFFDPENGQWNSHVDLGMWADLYLIAPATANTMGKMANGVADNLLLTSYLSAKCPVMVAPAMDLDMFQHPANTKNIEILKSYGNIILEPATGELASGLSGKGRMEEPEVIVEKVIDFFTSKKKLNNKTVLVTAGPTYEPIDPVRYIGNFSTGKMGFAIAEELANQGARVFLITGPTSLNTINKSISRIDVVTADEMYSAAINYFPKCDIAVMSAAVADFKPSELFQEKVKRGKDNLQINLVPNKDIAAELGKIKSKNQVLVGFALETNNELENATQKIKSKNLDFIVLNSLKEKGAGFGFNTNKISIIDKNGRKSDFELKLKNKVAIDIVNKLVDLLNQKNN
ncbi:MAG: phosphopantothenoylcysteine decarboxylase [Bacteroidetes bacterium GWC2_33_15]|nr:MAG: phosphopantothenoylcysteine decarboxylase [Bacteroidetes bacterium GWA2_33_15]OFX52126.1 MAG: phosphopantothenoylcysteine decarboxylase [Bacteroidetes bacterium GWC2_33_15]OFX64280.1 MAG: phosphopantothenoylcysteine decarboxylase [Bacteroidetes bacterium GWB2_32_14]OFX67685.1 MAG: phosphopantothenoylcysteine decarboxylase [Bacteroidetes bacterium GWD2_33_33]HAN19293.1 bifunctional phosphopantothenoylcysteine decarboxylase/phosphopantothenate--cysteine ligase CoaBC [Bacteroidales bacteri